MANNMTMMTLLLLMLLCCHCYVIMRVCLLAVQVVSARVFVGAVTQGIARCPLTEAALTDATLNQATLTACQAALVEDLKTLPASTFFMSTDAYRRQVAAGVMFKVRRGFVSCCLSRKCFVHVSSALFR